MAYSDVDVHFLKAAWTEKQQTEGLCQVVALVVDSEDRIVGQGLSKWPQGTHWIDDKDYQEFVDQAEVDAINGRDFKGCTLYTTRCPNVASAKYMVASGIERVAYIEENGLLGSGLHVLTSAKVRVVRVPLSVVLRSAISCSH